MKQLASAAALAFCAAAGQAQSATLTATFTGEIYEIEALGGSGAGDPFTFRDKVRLTVTGSPNPTEIDIADFPGPGSPDPNLSEEDAAFELHSVELAFPRTGRTVRTTTAGLLVRDNAGRHRSPRDQIVIHGDFAGQAIAFFASSFPGDTFSSADFSQVRAAWARGSPPVFSQIGFFAVRMGPTPLGNCHLNLGRVDDDIDSQIPSGDCFFVAEAEFESLKIRGRGGLSPVPLPGAAGMLVGAIGALGFAARRRRTG